MVNPLIDEATINDLRSTYGDDFIPELINTYLEETPLLIRDLQQALKDRNAPAFARAAHSIKSSSASLGALGFSAQAKELEMTGKAGDLSQASEKVSELSNAYSGLEQAMKSLL